MLRFVRRPLRTLIAVAAAVGDIACRPPATGHRPPATPRRASA